MGNFFSQSGRLLWSDPQRASAYIVWKICKIQKTERFSCSLWAVASVQPIGKDFGKATKPKASIYANQIGKVAGNILRQLELGHWPSLEVGSSAPCFGASSAGTTWCLEAQGAERCRSHAASVRCLPCCHGSWCPNRRRCGSKFDKFNQVQPSSITKYMTYGGFLKPVWEPHKLWLVSFFVVHRASPMTWETPIWNQILQPGVALTRQEVIEEGHGEARNWTMKLDIDETSSCASSSL